ncbi:MAG: glutamate racemase, partial [Zetaproteobacteria bacterium]
MSVTREIRRLLPQEPLAYVADEALLPYGDKPPTVIRQRLLELGDWLHAVQRVKMLVIACNTATAAAASALRRALPIPIIGMEPAVKPAASATRNRRIGVLATEGTLKSARFAGLLRTFAAGLHVYTQPCPGLVEAIEADDQARIRALLTRFLKPLRQRRIDTLVLGCTHYPLVRRHIAELAGP